MNLSGERRRCRYNETRTTPQTGKSYHHTTKTFFGQFERWHFLFLFSIAMPELSCHSFDYLFLRTLPPPGLLAFPSLWFNSDQAGRLPPNGSARLPPASHHHLPRPNPSKGLHHNRRQKLTPPSTLSPLHSLKTILHPLRLLRSLGYPKADPGPRPTSHRNSIPLEQVYPLYSFPPSP